MRGEPLANQSFRVKLARTHRQVVRRRWAPTAASPSPIESNQRPTRRPLVPSAPPVEEQRRRRRRSYRRGAALLTGACAARLSRPRAGRETLALGERGEPTRPPLETVAGRYRRRRRTEPRRAWPLVPGGASSIARRSLGCWPWVLSGRPRGRARRGEDAGPRRFFPGASGRAAGQCAGSRVARQASTCSSPADAFEMDDEELSGCDG